MLYGSSMNFFNPSQQPSQFCHLNFSRLGYDSIWNVVTFALRVGGVLSWEDRDMPETWRTASWNKYG